jgi:integrase
VNIVFFEKKNGILLPAYLFDNLCRHTHGVHPAWEMSPIRSNTGLGIQPAITRRSNRMIEQGENIKYIQNQLGHSTPMVTLNVYAHLMKPTNQEAVLRLENTIFEEDGSKMVAETKKDLVKNG